MVEAALTAGKRVESRATSLSGPVGQRAFDVVLAVLILVLCAPVMLLTALAIYLEDGGPIFYVQPRVGRYARTFGCLKFRSMMLDAEMRIDAVLSAYPQARAEWSVNRKLTRDPRVTRVGRVIRRRSLDELPQLINVLRGDMSMVGPRPHAVTHNDMFADQIRTIFRRHNVKPGITGWAQVNGLRGETDTFEKMQKRIEHDLYYIDNWSFFFDLKIMIMTVVLKRAYSNAY